MGRNLADEKYHRKFALIAARIARSVLPIFEKERPEDRRPREALEAIESWANGRRELGMKSVRGLSLGCHSAARACKSDAARFAARAAGHAVATWHAPTHAMAVPVYATKARFAAKKLKRK